MKKMNQTNTKNLKESTSTLITFSFPSFPFFLSFGRFFLKNLQTHHTQKAMVRQTKTGKNGTIIIAQFFTTVVSLRIQSKYIMISIKNALKRKG